MAKGDVSVNITDTVKFNFRVAGLIEHNNRVLLHMMGDVDFWNMPGGRVQADEDTLTALKRELDEEIGFKADNAKLIEVAENFFGFGGKRYHELLFVYKIVAHDSDKITSQQDFAPFDKTDAVYHWFDKSEVKDEKCLPRLIYELATRDTTKFIHSVDIDNNRTILE